MTQMTIPRSDGSTAIIMGRIAILPVGKTKVKFFIHNGSLSHFASGHRFGSLNDVKVRNMCALGHNARMTDRQAAQALIALTVDRVGVDGVLDTMNAQPVINL